MLSQKLRKAAEGMAAITEVTIRKVRGDKTKYEITPATLTERLGGISTTPRILILGKKRFMKQPRK